jgi:hypothetical protein
MPGKREDERRDEAPRTDLAPEREPYTSGYFGSDEEEGVERERDAGRDDGEEGERERRAAEDSAGGDRGLL